MRISTFFTGIVLLANLKNYACGYFDDKNA